MKELLVEFRRYEGEAGEQRRARHYIDPNPDLSESALEEKKHLIKKLGKDSV